MATTVGRGRSSGEERAHLWEAVVPGWGSPVGPDEVTQGEWNAPPFSWKTSLPSALLSAPSPVSPPFLDSPQKQTQGRSSSLVPPTPHLLPRGSAPVTATFLREQDGLAFPITAPLSRAPPPVIRLPSQHATKAAASMPLNPGVISLSSSHWPSQQPWTQLASLLPVALFSSITTLSWLSFNFSVESEGAQGLVLAPPSLPYLHRRKYTDGQHTERKVLCPTYKKCPIKQMRCKFNLSQCQRLIILSSSVGMGE